MRDRARRLLASLGGLALIGAIVTVPATTASATTAPPEAMVSSDGVTFRTDIPDGIFDSTGLLVPGDATEASLWVKNVTSGTADMRVSIVNLAASSQDLADSVTFSAIETSTGYSRTWFLSDMRSCDIVVPRHTIGAGATTQIDFRIEMIDVPGNKAQGEVGQIEFMVGMREAANAVFPRTACEPDIGRIAMTGYDTPTNWLVLAGALLGFGIILVARRRRKREES